MSNKSNKSRNSAKLFGAIFGGMLIGLPAISAAQAQQVPTSQAGPKVNPCPSIFYEEPHNSQVMVPQGCPANSYTTRMNAQGMGMSNSAVAPTPEQTRLGVGGEAPSGSSYNTQQNQSNLGGRYQNAVAAVSPTDGRITVRLINNTNAPITFQAVGDTQVRTLAGRSEVALQGLRVPTTVTFYRQDRGLLKVTPRSSESGVLEVSMQETTDFAMDRTALRIENNGNVYLN
jgi:hypothetical protein